MGKVHLARLPSPDDPDFEDMSIGGIPFVTKMGYQNVFARSINRWNPKAMAVPEILAQSVEFLRFTAKLAERLNLEFPANIDEHGFASDNAVPGGFGAIMSVMGTAMDPMPLPLIDNKPIRDRLELTDREPRGRAELIFKQLIQTVLSNPVRSGFRLNKRSSCGMPLMIGGHLEIKKRWWYECLAEWTSIAKLFARGDYGALFKEHNIIFAAYPTRRSQPEAGRSKERMVFDMDYAMSAGRQGREFAANKRLSIPGASELHEAMRIRLAFAYSGKINYLLTSMLAPFREYYLNEFAFTWKHNNIPDKIARFKYLVGTDVANMDATVPRWFNDWVCEHLTQYWQAPLPEMMRVANLSPMLMMNPAVDGTGIKWSANPFEAESHDQWMGLKSGIANNPDYGKIFMVGVYLCLIDSVTQDVLESGIDTILRGHHQRYGLLNQGDDNLIGVQDSALFEALRDALDENPDRIAKLEKEASISFLGNVAYKKHGTIRVAPNVVSSVVNLFAHERSVDSRFRPYYKEGYIARQYLYAQAPVFKDVWAITEEVFKDEFSVSLGRAFASGPDYHKPEMGFDMSSPFDREVMLDPSKILWKTGIAENVSPELRDSLLGSVSVEDNMEHTAPLWKQKIA